MPQARSSDAMRLVFSRPFINKPISVFVAWEPSSSQQQFQSTRHRSMP
jgi:hypothetical protein